MNYSRFTCVTDALLIIENLARFPWCLFKELGGGSLGFPWPTNFDPESVWTNGIPTELSPTDFHSAVSSSCNSSVRFPPVPGSVNYRKCKIASSSRKKVKKYVVFGIGCFPVMSRDSIRYVFGGLECDFLDFHPLGDEELYILTAKCYSDCVPSEGRTFPTGLDPFELLPIRTNDEVLFYAQHSAEMCATPSFWNVYGHRIDSYASLNNKKTGLVMGRESLIIPM